MIHFFLNLNREYLFFKQLFINQEDNMSASVDTALNSYLLRGR